MDYFGSLLRRYNGTRSSQQEMIWDQSVQIDSIRASWYQWSCIQTLLHKAKCCYQNFVSWPSVPKNSVEHVFETPDHAFPNTTVVRCTRWVKLPRDTFLDEGLSRNLLVPVWNVSEELLFSGNEICSVVWPWNWTDGIPLRAVNFSLLNTQLLVSFDGTTSEWTALVVKQVKSNLIVFLSTS